MRQVDIASKAAFTALRASSESLGAHIGLKLRGVTSAYLLCMAARLLSLTVRTHSESLVDEGIQRSAEGITAAILSHGDVMQT